MCAVPYKDQGTKELLNPIDQYVYSMISRDCTNVVYICDKKSRDCYQKRNKFMVENSRRIIGVIKDEKAKSGTLQTINMAKKSGLELNIIYLDKNPVFYLSDDSEVFIHNSGSL